MQQENKRKPIVLVHGAWGGAWVWRRVLGPLRQAGHEVHALTLTGDGDRSHLRHPDIRLSHHITDVVAAVRAEELQDVVLVGHSYGGMVVTGAADRLLQDDPAAVRTIVYVDAMVPLSGERWCDSHAPEVVAQRTASAQANGGAFLPPSPDVFGLDEHDAQWLQRRHVPHPFGPYLEPIHYDEARWRGLRKVFIDCTEPAFPTIAAMRDRVRRMDHFQVQEMATGHFPMISQPARLVALLLEAAQ